MGFQVSLCGNEMKQNISGRLFVTVDRITLSIDVTILDGERHWDFEKLMHFSEASVDLTQVQRTTVDILVVIGEDVAIFDDSQLKGKGRGVGYNV